MITCLIVDDEYNCIVSLRELLGRDLPDVKIIGEVASVQEAYDWLLQSKAKPDIVFLDIQMPAEDGFSLLRKLPSINFSVIFTTAYDSYAIKAIRFSALDYLLKPINKTDLILAVDRYKHNRNQLNNMQQINEFRINMQSGNVFGKLGIPTMSEVFFVEIEDILYLEGDNNYTRIYHIAGVDSYVLSSKNIGYYEELLKSSHFFRIHNSYIINLKKVTKYIRSKTGAIELSNGKTFDISKRRKEEFLKFLKI